MPMTESKFGVLLVTGGRTHQEMYGPGFAADARCRLVGLTDEPGLPADRQAWNRELAAKLATPYLDDLDQALARSDVDLVSVCCEPERRARISTKVVEAGKHLYSDKPVGSNIDDVRALVRLAEKCNVQTHMFTLMRSEWSERASRLYRSGHLGELQAIHMDLLFAKGIAGTVPVLQKRKEVYPPKRFTFVDSKREVFTTAIYSLAFISSLLGERFKSVDAVTANYFFSEHVRNDVEDFGALLLQTDSDISVTVTAGRIGWTSHPQFGPIQIVLVGEKGTAKIDAYKPRLEIYNDETPWMAPRRNPDDPMGFWNSTQDAVGTRPKTVWQMPAGGQSDQSYFIDCLESQKPSDMPIDVAAHATRTIFAAYRSAATGQPVCPDEV